MRNIERSLVSALLAGALLLGACARTPSGNDDPDLVAESLGGGFLLTGDDGRPVALADFRGRMVLLFFGYTACPDICPTTLSRIGRAYSLLAKEGIPRSEVQTLFITVDPARDTPDKIRKYLTYFGVNAIGATGTVAEIEKVAKSYGAAFWREEEPASAAGYLMSHSTSIYLIDRGGKVRHIFDFEDPPERIAELVERLANADCCTGKPKAIAASPIPNPL